MRALAIDFGERRIGLALSDPSGTLARPWRALERRGSDEAIVAEIAGIISALGVEDDGLTTIVIGLPSRLDGTPHGMTARVRAFAEALRARVTQGIVFQDERLSSREAERRLAIREGDWRKRKALIDAASAAVILQDYLDGLADSRGLPGGEDG